ncbi:dTMP kinase [Massilia sp. W12]|uniref:dTMP kinase n=1 Tax=Massilia sp. W12 TaxID=3126507 RepID=UPI0030CF72B6
MSTITYQPRFISMEGIDGAGKSTHLPFIRSLLTQAGLEVVQTREPGGTPLGETLRAILLSQTMSAQTEAMLMFAARRENYLQVIAPALARGAWVLCDRFTDSSLAYQGGGRAMPDAELAQLQQIAIGPVQPDLTLLFDVPLEVAQARIGSSRELDKFEQEQADFHARVRQYYLQLAAANPQRYRLLDARHSIAELQAQLQQILQDFLHGARC